MFRRFFTLKVFPKYQFFHPQRCIHTTLPFRCASAEYLTNESPKPVDSTKDSQGTDKVSILDSNNSNVSVEPLIKFSDLTDIPQWLADGLQRQKYPTATKIQQYTIPLLEKGHDLIGLAPTGSGKTVAFAVPALKRLKPTDHGCPTVLVLAPTRELVQQTAEVFRRLSCGAVRICEAYGGAPRELQTRRLYNGCDVLVACPGRLKDFLDSGDVSLDHLSFLVFDEADRLLDMGFQIQLDEIVRYINPSRPLQTMMWSATWPYAVQELANNYMAPSKLLIRAGTAGTGAQVNNHIDQKIIYLENMQSRIDHLTQLIRDGTINDNKDKLIIFVERQQDTDFAAESLSKSLGIDPRYVGSIHGGLQQRFRDAVMGKFKNNHIRLLVATDVASRGLDIPDVTCVVNLQAPKNIDVYCHRIGRTGRAGRKGSAFTFVGKSDGGLAGDLITYLGKCGSEVPSYLNTLAKSYDEKQERRRFSGRDRYGGRNQRRRDKEKSSPPPRFTSNTFETSNGW